MNTKLNIFCALGTAMIFCASSIAYEPSYYQDYNQYNQPQQNTQYSQPNYTYSAPFQQYQNSSQTYANTQSHVNYNYSTPYQGHVIIMPAGTQFPATVNYNLSTANITAGDSVSFVLAEPFYYNGLMIAPAGSTVYGNAVIAKKAGRTGKNAQLKINFNSIMTPQGQNIPISGKIATSDGTGILKGGTAKNTAVNYAKNTAIGAAVGALAGTALGPLSGGSVGKGAIYGTAIGGGVGVAKALVDKGAEVVIQAGERIDIILDQPITINTSAQKY